MTPLYPRHLRPLLLEALNDTRVVFVTGARQVGKTTLTREVAREEHPMRIVSLDESATRQGAARDPAGFLAALSSPVLIDEIQHVPDLLLEIKSVVDRDTRPGRFLLTGSANILTSKKVKDALTGRIETLNLWPLAQSELQGAGANFVDALFAAEPAQLSGCTVGRQAFARIVLAGGYPEALTRTGRARARWFESYIDSTLDQDLRDISDAIKLEEMPRLLRLIATQAANLLSYRNVASRLGLSAVTVKAYVGLLEQLFLVRRLQAWRPGLGAREVSTPKIYVTDSGVLANLLGADEARIAEDDQVTGKILENFVAMEVLKHVGWAANRVRLYHYQRDREDVDLVLERADGQIVAIEVKARASIGNRDSHWLVKLRERTGSRFVAGVVIHPREQTVPLGDRLWALPIAALWA
ncbi:MAG: ATP-binding protein [Solirubrobacteraceae bacterium]